MARILHIDVLLPELRAYAASISGSRSDTEDLVQDAIERALKSDRRPERLDELRPWMFRVLRNLLYDDFRKARVRREYNARVRRLSDDAHGEADIARDVLVRVALGKLPPDKREVLLLVDVVGLSYAETAQVMGVPAGTIMSRISRARRALIALVDIPSNENAKATKKK